METGSDWGRRVAKTVGEQVAYYRNLRAVFTTPDGTQQVVNEPMTLQQLSDRCGTLKYPIARSVLSKLEKGHRASVSVDEVQVLAAALHVPPVLLMFPLGRSQSAEVLPGVHVHPWDAIRWYDGSLPGEYPHLALRDGPMTLFALHQHELERRPRDRQALVAGERRLRQASTPRERREAEADIKYARQALSQISGLRQTMRNLGFLTPALPADVAAEIGEEPAGG